MPEPLPIPAQPSAGVFVGRQREMSALKTALDDAQTGQPRLVMLVGEPGIGKTSTAKEFTEHAVAQGAQVLWGRCYESIGMPPYWPWVQAIRSYVRDRDPDLLRSEMGTGAGDIAEIVPGVRERLPDLEPSPGLDNPEQARVRLFDSITNFLERASRSQPLVLVLDNLHWADRPSLLLLEFLAQEFANGQMMVLGTYRDAEISAEHPLTRVLGELTKIPNFQRLSLKGLSQEDVGELIQRMSGATPAPDLIESVFSHTQGNPLFVTEVVRLLLQDPEITQEGQLGMTGRELGIPDGVREAIGGRLIRLSDACNQALTIASVIGREFGLDQLEQVIPEGSAELLLASMEEALNARIIEEIPHAVGRYQFSHVLVQETLASTLSATRRSMMHGDIGKALEVLYAGELNDHAAELADHFSQAGPGIAGEKLMGYSLMAGERALAGYAYEDALAHFQRGLDSGLRPEDGNPPDEVSADLLFGLGRAQVAMLQLEEAMGSLSGAFDYYTQRGDILRALVVAEHPLPAYAGRFSWASQLSAQALDLVPADSHDAGRLLSNHVRLVGFQEADYAGVMSAFQRALTIAQREKDAPMEMRTLANGAIVDVYHLRYEEGLEKAWRRSRSPAGSTPHKTRP
ncbi:MAG: AAA family ATPase [Chloroflexi bacterium]|nr:AAA family ATPase [Chloroflexota bacterium]